MGETIHIRRLEMVISLKKNYVACTLPMAEHIDILCDIWKHNNLITTNCGACFLDFEFKVCNIALIIPTFREQFIFINLHLVF